MRTNRSGAKLKCLSVGFKFGKIPKPVYTLERYTGEFPVHSTPLLYRLHLLSIALSAKPIHRIFSICRDGINL